MRGAGKSTLGRMLAEDLEFPFVELSREIEKLAGCSISEILGLYGQNAYRRYERRALEEAIDAHPEAVIATAGGLVSTSAASISCSAAASSVWLKADPEDHMGRVAAQGDLRPMAASREAMEDLKSILAGRAAFYSKADIHIDTSAQPLVETFEILRAQARDAIGLPGGRRRLRRLPMTVVMHYRCISCIKLPMSGSAMDRVDYQTAPALYRHWKLKFDGPIATLIADFDENGGLRPGYKLKLNSYDLGVDIELNDAVNRIRFEHPEVRVVVIASARERVFCSGANIFMLGVSSHAWKVNFCKFTNETRNGLENSSKHEGLKFLAAVSGSCAGGGYELALACDEILLIDDRSSAVSLPEVPLLGVLPGTGGLTRLTDKRHVRHDLADVFCTTSEGVRGEKALAWRLVDAIAKPAQFAADGARARAGAGGGQRPPIVRHGRRAHADRANDRSRRPTLSACDGRDRPRRARRDIHDQGPERR